MNFKDLEELYQLNPWVGTDIAMRWHDTLLCIVHKQLLKQGKDIRRYLADVIHDRDNLYQYAFHYRHNPYYRLIRVLKGFHAITRLGNNLYYSHQLKRMDEHLKGNECFEDYTVDCHAKVILRQLYNTTQRRWVSILKIYDRLCSLPIKFDRSRIEEFKTKYVRNLISQV